MMPLVLTSHEEKVTFLTRFLNDAVPNYNRDTCLMIVGSGGNGKTKVLQEILQMNIVNVVVIQEKRYTFHPSHGNSENCATIMVNNGTPEDFMVANYLGANIVEFAKDPNFEN